MSKKLDGKVAVVTGASFFLPNGRLMPFFAFPPGAGACALLLLLPNKAMWEVFWAVDLEFQ